MKKKLFAMMVVGAMGMSMLMGCGGTEDTAETKAPAQESVQEEGSKAEEKTDECSDGMTETGSEDSEDDVIAQLKSILTLGYIGASESNEELYFATDDDVDMGILGIVDNGDATFLAGDITESDGELTITDSETGDSLSFTVEEDVDDEGTSVLIITITSNGAKGALYAADASDVIDAMSQY